jgi:hypothetical protein
VRMGQLYALKVLEEIMGAQRTGARTFASMDLVKSIQLSKCAVIV